MTVESVNFISDLDQNNPAGGDSISEGDDHIRNIKRALTNTFPNVNEAVTVTAADLNKVTDFVAGGNGIFASCKWNGTQLMYGHNVSSVVMENLSQYRVYFQQPTDGFDHHYAIQVTTIGTTAMTIACVNGQFEDSVSISVREELSPNGGSWGTPTRPVAFYMTMVDMIQTEANANT
jgi:hypothetical protein